MRLTRDEVSLGMFNCHYGALSAWGKRHVDQVMVQLDIVETPRTATLLNLEDPATLRRENERLSRELDKTRIENLELLDENADLKAELEELRAEWNPPTT